MTVEEYLHTSFENHDPEFLDGEVVQRAALYSGKECAGLLPVLSLRLRVARDRIRVADIAVFDHEPEGEVPSTPPLLAIEIFSPDDRIGYIIPKLEEYRRSGVKHVWAIDPEDRKLFTYRETGLHEVTELAAAQLTKSC
jgi:Uma2 family endonuclease